MMYKYITDKHMQRSHSYAYYFYHRPNTDYLKWTLSYFTVQDDLVNATIREQTLWIANPINRLVKTQQI